MSDLTKITVSDSNWSHLIQKVREYDFYHTQGYQLLETENEPSLLVVNFESGFIAIPLVVRRIEGTDYFDCTSVYGYCGPITTFNKDELTNDITSEFQKQLIAFFNDNKIVSVFSRLHPLIDNDVLLTGLGKIKTLNKTVAIDLTISPEEQRRGYRKSNKSEINQLRGKKGYSVREAKSKEDIDSFVDIYYETMKRVDAKDMYYFSRDYFDRLLSNSDFGSKLLIAIKDEVIAAGAIFTVAGDIMQYHLAGTREEFIYDTPMKLILDEARLLGNGLDVKNLHLGGGVGGSDDDSLFKFKSGFSKNFYDFRIWQLIVDEKAYDELVKEKGIKDIESNFFPLYRA